MGMAYCAAREGVRVRPVITKTVFNEVPKMIEKKNLELYYLFWLDSSVRSPEFIETHDELRSIINYLKIFERNLEFQEELEKITNGKIFLIVNCIQGLPLLPIIHNHKQLHSIYMYHNGDSINTDGISIQYKKVRGIYDSFVMAKRYLEDDVEIQTDFDDPMVMDLFNEMEYREKFTLFLKTVNVNAKDIYDKQTKNRLIEICEEYYEDNDTEISFLEEFTQLYKPEQAISWYMRESCLHRILSRAFIDRDLNIIVDMYSFIVDINRNLQQQCIKQPSSLRVFRGQILSNEKLNQLKIHINQIITMQCIFSAQTSRDETDHLLQSIEPTDINYRRILFEIDVLQDYTIINNEQPASSKTVLFMLGATFKIIDVTETSVLLSQYTSRLNGNNDLANESPLIIRGILTYLKDGTRDAIQYFENILRSQSSSIDLVTHSSVYGQLGYLKQKSGNLASATKMYEQAINYGTMQFGLYIFYLEQAAQYHGSILDDWEKASTLWLQKLNIENAFLSKEEKAQTYENLARAAMKTKQSAKTIEYTLAAIENLPKDHPHLSFLHQQLECAQKNLSEKVTT